MKVLIVGCGRVGSRLAVDFAAKGHDVSIVDLHGQAFRRLGASFPGRTIVGTGIDEDVLRSAGIETADVFIAVTNGDNTNIMSAQIARTVYRVPRVVLRIYDPARAQVYRRLGLNVVCPTATVANMIEEQVFQPNPTRAGS